MLKQFILLTAITCGALGTSRLQAQPFKAKLPKYETGHNIGIVRMVCTPHGTSGAAVTASFTHSPCGIAISKAGRVAVSEYGDNGTQENVQIWNSVSDFRSGVARAQVLTGLYTPEGICFTPDEKLIVIETTGTETGVRQYELKNGQYAPKPINGANFFANSILNNPRGVVAVSNNSIIISNDGRGNLVGLDLLTGNYSESDKDGILKAKSAKAIALWQPLSGGPTLCYADFDDRTVYINASFTSHAVPGNFEKGVPVSIADGRPVDLLISNDMLLVKVQLDNGGDAIEQIDLTAGNNITTATRYIMPNTKGDHLSWGIAVDHKDCSLYSADGDNKRVVRFQ